MRRWAKFFLDPPARWSWTDRRPPLAAGRILGQANVRRSSSQGWTVGRLVWSSLWWCGCPWRRRGDLGLQKRVKWYATIHLLEINICHKVTALQNKCVEMILYPFLCFSLGNMFRVFYTYFMSDWMYCSTQIFFFTLKFSFFIWSLNKCIQYQFLTNINVVWVFSVLVPLLSNKQRSYCKTFSMKTKKD